MATNPRRTAEELKDPQYNYYIAFGLEIDETNPKQLEQTIKTVLGNPSGTNIRLRRLLEIKDDILKTMVEDAKYDEKTGQYTPKTGARKEEKERAIEFKLEEAVEVIQDMCSKSGRDFILLSDLDNIRAKSKRYFTIDELKKRIAYLQNQGIKLIDNVDKTMPFAEYQKVEDNLKIIGKKNLYDFLGVSPNESAAGIKTANDRAYSDGTKTNDLKRKQAVSGLNASVKTLLLSADAKYRTNYDNYLKLKDGVWSKFELRKTYGLNLSIDEYEEFVQLVIDSLGVKVDEAERIIFVGCNYYRIFIAGLEDVTKVKFDTCPYCNKIYKKGEKSCPHCGKPLEIICWNCHGKMAYSKTNKTCPSCGATPQAQEILQKKSEVLSGLLRLPQSDIPKLETALLEIKNVIPNYASFSESVAYKKIKGYEDAIADRKKTEAKLGDAYREDEKKIQKLIAEKKYFTAEGQAKALKTKYNTYNAENTEKLVATISATTDRSRQFLALAKSCMARNDSRTAIGNAAKAIDLCADCIEASAVMQKYPPVAPVSARCTSNGNSVKIEWTVSGEQDFVTYTVVKKIGIAPVNADDGSIVAENLSIAYTEDSTVVPATLYYYAVYAERYGVKSKIIVAQAPPIYADVSQVRQEVVNDCIKVSWTAPQNVKEVKVYKRSGNVAPDKPESGEPVRCETTGFTDSNVTGENAYLIVCVYDKGVLSRGVRSVFKPYKALNAVKNPALIHDTGTNYIFGGESDGGEVKLYYSEAKLPVPVGKTQRLNDFGTVGKGLVALPTMINLDGKTVVSLPANKLGWVYPVTQNDQLFIVSEPIVFNTIKGQNLRYELLGGTLTLTGTVNERADYIIIKVSEKDFPKTMDDDGACFRFKREDLVKNGKIELKLKSGALSYISVFTEFKTGTVITYAEPFIFEEPVGEKQKVDVRYKLDYTVSPVKPFKLTVTFEADSEITVPAFVLMKGRPRPLNKTDGELVERVESVELKKGMFSKRYTAKCTVTVPPAAVNMKFIIFTAEDKSDVRFREVLTM